MVLGYTRAGHPVLVPSRQTPDMAMFSSWTPGDHLDASRILMEHGERVSEPIGQWCASWAVAHFAIGKKAKAKDRRARIRGAAEAAILAGGRRRRP